MNPLENIEAYFENFGAIHEVSTLANNIDKECYANIEKLKTNPYFNEVMPDGGSLLNIFIDQNQTLKEMIAPYKLTDADLAKLSTLICAQVEEGISDDQKFIYVTFVKLIMTTMASASVAAGAMEGLTDFIAEPKEE